MTDKWPATPVLERPTCWQCQPMTREQKKTYTDLIDDAQRAVSACRLAVADAEENLYQAQRDLARVQLLAIRQGIV